MTIRLHKTEELHEIDEKAEFALLNKKLTMLTDLKDEVEGLKTQIINRHGSCKKHGINISVSSGRKSVSYKDLFRDYGITDDNIEEYTKYGKDYWTVKKY